MNSNIDWESEDKQQQYHAIMTTSSSPPLVQKSDGRDGGEPVVSASGSLPEDKSEQDSLPEPKVMDKKLKRQLVQKRYRERRKEMQRERERQFKLAEEEVARLKLENEKIIAEHEAMTKQVSYSTELLLHLGGDPDVQLGEAEGPFDQDNMLCLEKESAAFRALAFARGLSDYVWAHFVSPSDELIHNIIKEMSKDSRSFFTRSFNFTFQRRLSGLLQEV